MDTTVLVLIIVAVILLVAVLALGVMLSRRKRSERLQKQFGSEYERSVAHTGDRKTAETELRERQQRRSQLDIRDLRPEERTRYTESWMAVQRNFVDDPTRALNDADALVVEVTRVRGYPVEEFDRRAEDISVDHPEVVRHYREARSVRDASTDGSADTERQRHALTSYRALVEELVGAGDKHDDHQQHRDGEAGGGGGHRAEDRSSDNARGRDSRPTEETTR